MMLMLLYIVGILFVSSANCILFTTINSNKFRKISPITNMVSSNNNFISDKITKILLQRGSIGQSQGNRLHYHAAGSKRKWDDHFMWTHLFLMTSSIVAFINKSYELFLLLGVTTTLSTLYHYEYEKPSKLAKLEGMSAKVLFIYGTCQTILKAPSISIGILIAELLLLFTTLSFFLVTNIYPELYDKYHCFGLHVIPSLWGIIVAIWHKPFFL